MKKIFILTNFILLIYVNILSYQPPTEDIGRPGDRGDAALISERSDSKDSDLS